MFISYFVLPIYFMIDPFQPAATFIIIAGLILFVLVAFACIVTLTMCGRKNMAWDVGTVRRYQRFNMQYLLI